MSMQAVLFDMDGTLVNSEPYWLIAETELMARYGHKWSDEDQAHSLGGPLPKVGAYMSNLAQGAEDPLFFEVELVRLVSEQFKAGLEFIPGALELVTDLVESGIPMALVSASPRLLVDAALELLPPGTFLASVSNQDVTISKPHPESYLLAAKHLGVDIKRCVVLEDSKTGIDAGLASGAVVIGIPHLITYPPTERLHLRPNLVDLTTEEIKEIFYSLNSDESLEIK
ncbi:MAG: HAD family phosphatase [Actinomycetota bacterium]